MIKLTLGAEAPQTEKPFPKLMITKDGTLVFFYKSECGFLLTKNSKDTILNVGEYYDNWLMEKFTDYNEPITIQNA